MGQLTIPLVFETAAVKKATAPLVDLDALENYALLYTVSEKGNHSGIRFMMTLEDAQKWCSAPESSGTLHGTRWAYFYTSVARFLGRDYSYTGVIDELDLRDEFDNGSFDDRIAAAGCEKIGLSQIRSVLRPFGVVVWFGKDERPGNLR